MKGGRHGNEARVDEFGRAISDWQSRIREKGGRAVRHRPRLGKSVLKLLPERLAIPNRATNESVLVSAGDIVWAPYTTRQMNKTYSNDRKEQHQS